MNKITSQTENSLHHILYIEDDLAEIYLMKMSIEESSLPLHFDIVHTFEEAIEAFDPAKHKLVISDYNLPDGDAPYIAEILLQKCPDVTIITLSNAYTKKRIKKAKAAGVSECLLKSTPQEFLDKISELLML